MLDLIRFFQWIGVAAFILFIILCTLYIAVGIGINKHPDPSMRQTRSGSKPEEVAAEAADVFEESNNLVIHYYKANQNFGAIIFALSVLTSLSGFVLIMVLASTLGSTTSGRQSTVEQDRLQTLTAILGIVSQFIAATFLVIYRSISNQATRFAETLAEISINQRAIMQGWALYDLDEDLAAQTISTIAIALAQHRPLRADDTGKS